MRRQFLITAILLCGWMVFSGWGIKGHWKINEKAPPSFPPGMAFLMSTWPGMLAAHSSDADERKKTDPAEAGKHYINLDSYPEFLQSGRIPQTLDSVIALHGSGFVMDAGILPWAILAAFDSLKYSFSRHDWNQSVLYASDLGHYIGDGHQPLHLTKNYDGQLTGQKGIHGRYETQMVGEFYDLLVFEIDSALFIRDPGKFVFDFIYRDFKDADSLLQADAYAKSIAGNTSSSAYYKTLWSKTGNITNRLFKTASLSLASLIYTAWTQAGSPVFYPNSIRLDDHPPVTLEQNYPNPFSHHTSIRFSVSEYNSDIHILIYEMEGKFKVNLFEGRVKAGNYHVDWDASDCREGIYFLIMTSGNFYTVRKLIVLK